MGPVKFVKEKMTLRIFRKWADSLSYSIAGGWILLMVLTLRWQQGAGSELAPMWGFPLPWAFWPPISSGEWKLSIPALLVNLWAYSLVVAAAGELLRPHLPPISKWLRRVAYALLVGACGWFGFFWFIGLSNGAHRAVLFLSTEQVTRVSICFASGCYLTH